MKNELKNAILISVTVIAIIVVVYLVTAVFLTGEIGNKKTNEENNEKTTSQSEISYDGKIIAGRIFNQKQDTYLVMVYSEENASESLKNAISSYSKDVKLYKVNTDEAINKSIVSETDNPTPMNNAEVRVSKNALITITSKKVTSYINNEDEIINALK